MELGIKGAAETVVVYENTAAAVGSGALEVFSTPSMIALMEKASRELVQPYLEEGRGFSDRCAHPRGEHTGRDRPPYADLRG